MSNMDEVKKAVAFLDKHVEDVEWLTADWRYKIDRSTLNMSSIRNCVLGQLHPEDYNGAISSFIELDEDGWFEVSEAFASYGYAWREYLSRFTPLGDYVPGTTWQLKEDPKTLTRIHGVVEFGGCKTVVHQRNGWSGVSVSGIRSFEHEWELPTPFKEGDILWSGDQNGPVFVYLDRDKLIRFGGMSNYGTISHGPLSFYKEKFGELLLANKDDLGGYDLLKSILKF